MIEKFIEEYEAERKKILDNKDLSQSGKQKALQALQKEMTEEARVFIKDLRKLAVINGLYVRDAQQAFELEKKRALDALDYERLNYEAQALQSEISRADSISEVREIWERVKDEGDAYKIKAWKDTAAGKITSLGGQDITEEKAKLLGSIAKADTSFVDNPELTELEKSGIEELGAIEKDVRRLARTLTGDNVGLGINEQGVVKRVFAGIKFEGQKIKLDFDYSRRKNPFEPDQEIKESAEDVFKRVEKEYQEEAQAYVKYAKDKFDVDLDPDFSDLSD